jgi:hypothetical protein
LVKTGFGYNDDLVVELFVLFVGATFVDILDLSSVTLRRPFSTLVCLKEVNVCRTSSGPIGVGKWPDWRFFVGEAFDAPEEIGV